MASPILPLNNISKEVLAELKFDREKNELQPLMQQDTIDEKMLKLKARQYEEAVAKLRSTKEWQELESLKAEMIAEQLKQLEDMGPIIEDALRSVELETAFDEINLKELKEQMAQLEIQLGENRVNEDIQRVMEKSARVFEESMAEVEARMAEIKVEELEDLAQEQIIKAEKYAREAELMARNAEKIASEAKNIAQRAEKFFDELKPELIKDGYINNNEDLDDLRFEDGKVYVNDVEVKSKDAKKYYEIRDRHLGKDTSFFTN